MNPAAQNIDREGVSLVDHPEMTKAVGAALDGLAAQWK